MECALAAVAQIVHMRIIFNENTILIAVFNEAFVVELLRPFISIDGKGRWAAKRGVHSNCKSN